MILSVFMQTDHCDISIINLIKLEAIQRLFYVEVCVPELFFETRQDETGVVWSWFMLHISVRNRKFPVQY